MRTSLTNVYGKINYIKRRIKETNELYHKEIINDVVLKRKLKHYNNYLLEFEREYVLLPNLHMDLIKIKKILKDEIKQLNKELNKNIYINIDWNKGTITFSTNKND